MSFVLVGCVLLGVAAASSVVHVINKHDLTTVGTRFVFTSPIADVSAAEAVAFCHATIVRDGSSESDDTASLHFGFNEKYFRQYGFRLCTHFELLTVSAIVTLPDGTYPTFNSPDGDDVNAFNVVDGRLDTETELTLASPTGDAYTLRTRTAVCCSAAQMTIEGEGSK